MAQIQKGTTYGTTSPSNLVSSTNLNNHVDDAVLLPGAITDQTAKVVLAAADTVLVHSSADTALRKTTMAQVFATPQPIGSSTASSGAFTTLSASSTVSGTGFSTYLASPPAIGGTAAAAGSFTTLSASSTVSGNGFSTYLASPPAIGTTTAAAGKFTSLEATGQYKGSVTAITLLDIDCSAGNYFTKTINGNSTFTFSNVPSGAYGMIVEIENTSGTITWPAAVKFPNDTAPTLSTGKTHVFVFITDDSGSRWRGVAAVNYVT
jgi:hypothetical protein